MVSPSGSNGESPKGSNGVSQWVEWCVPVGRMVCPSGSNGESPLV